MNLASIQKLLKKPLAAKEKDYDTFNTLLIVNQTMPYDVWRSAQPGAMNLTIIKYEGITVKDGNETLPFGYKIDCEYYYKKLWTKGGIQISTDMTSTKLEDKYLILQFDNSKPQKITFTAYNFYIEADYNRDGKPVIPKETYKGKNIPWTWGDEGYGPVLMVINEGNEEQQAFENPDYKAIFSVKKEGPKDFPLNHSIILQTDDTSSRRIAVYGKESRYGAIPLIGKGKCFSDPIFKNNNEPVESLDCFAFALQYPDRNFDGLITLALNLAIFDGDKWIPVYYEATEDSNHCPYLISTQFRVSPWIMTPNTQSPQEFYAARVTYSYFNETGYQSNELFINQLKKEYWDKFSKEMRIVEPKYDRNDPWMQDELEFGYSQMPNGIFNVFLHSPRDRGLALYPELELILQQQIGYITRNGTGIKCSLDSFGNLEVTPPLNNYPLGRIIYGGCLPGSNGRKMMRSVRDFLEAQLVQKPLELYTDWLRVGHVDEMLSFVPHFNNTVQKFKLLLASPDTFYVELKKEKPEKVLFEGKKDINGNSMAKTVGELLCDDSLFTFNKGCQDNIDKNRKLLINELQITNEDIIDIPALYYKDNGKASAYMPGMVNMVVLDKYLLIPNPFSDFIEEYVRKQLDSLGLECNFIDDWSSYHNQDGEVHCGTNVMRIPLSTSWWNLNLKKEQITIPEESTMQDLELTFS